MAANTKLPLSSDLTLDFETARLITYQLNAITYKLVGRHKTLLLFPDRPSCNSAERTLQQAGWSASAEHKVEHGRSRHYVVIIEYPEMEKIDPLYDWYGDAVRPTVLAARDSLQRNLDEKFWLTPERSGIRQRKPGPRKHREDDWLEEAMC